MPFSWTAISVAKTAYVPTDHDNLLKCLLGALDELVQGVDTSKIERVVLSTTLITNMIAEGKTDPVALVLIPGPGTNPKDYSLGESIILDGAIDFRGKEIDRLNEPQIKEAASKDLGPGPLPRGRGGQVLPEKSCPRAEGRRDPGRCPARSQDRAGPQGLRPAQLSPPGSDNHAHRRHQRQI